MEIKLRINRFDPDRDALPHFDEMSVDIEENLTVLDALMLAWQQDPGLSFRRSCRSAICGSCAIRINGRPALACRTSIGSVAAPDEPVVLQPLPHFRQLKDLVVDLEPFFDSLSAAIPWLVLKQDYRGRMDQERVREIESPATCILCGLCRADLEKFSGMEPAAVVKALRFALDPRDAFGLDRLRFLHLPPEVLKLFIGELPRTCPKGIEISETILGFLA